MSGLQEPRRPSRGPLAASLLLLLIALGTLAVFLVGERERKAATLLLESRLSARSQLHADSLARRIDRIRNDVRFLVRVPAIAGVTRAASSGGIDPEQQIPLATWTRRLESIFRVFVEKSSDIAQLRLIGQANNGRELIRVDRRGDGIVVTPPGELQSKGDRPYFQEAARLAEGQVYVSDLDLNRERGQVELPWTPTLRVAAPLVMADGRAFGVVVMNIKAEALLAPLRENLPGDLRSYLINNRGDFVLHPDPQRTFGSDRGQPWRWDDELHALPAPGGYPTSLRRYESPRGVLHVFAQKVSLDAADHHRDLTIAVAAPDTLVARAVAQARLALLFNLLIALLVGGAVALYLRQRRRTGEQQALLAAMVESSHDAIIGKSLDGVITSWNRGAESIFGWTAEEVIGKSPAGLIVPPEAVAEENERLARAARGEVLASFTTVRIRRDGSPLDASVTVSPIRDSSGRIIGLSTTTRDITDILAASARINALNASLEQQVSERTAEIESYSELQRAILTNASSAIIATDTRGVITLFNPAAERLLGYSAMELIGSQTPGIFHDSDEVRARATELSEELKEPVTAGFEAFTARVRRGLHDEHEWTYIRKDGSRFPVVLAVTTLKSDDGTINGFLGIASDISLHEKAKRQLESARDLLLDAANVAELGIWTWTIADDTLVWNERMYEIYGLPATANGDPLRYEQWISRIHPDDAEATAAELTGAAAGTCEYNPIFRIVRPDQSVRFIQSAANVDRDEDGKALRIVGINRDITQQREQEATLRRASTAADNANRAKSEFLANMSHEIRSPMHAVLGMLQLLQQTGLNGRQLDYAVKAESAGRSLLGILDDILDFSRVEAGKLTLDPHPFSVDKLLRDVAIVLSANIGTKDVELLFDIDPNLPDWVAGDALRLRQILLNLASNAIKFTERGEIALSVRLMAEQGPTLSIAFALRDTGIGISPEQQRRVFEGFSQAEASTARRYGGSGLGLSICQRLVHLMGGQLSLKSEPGRGSTFQFVVDFQRAAEPRRTAPLSVSKLQRLHCLVVDDHPNARLVLAKMLTSFGWRVDLAESGRAALAEVAYRGKEQPYDVIFVDWRMPELDGWETSEKIRQMLPEGAGSLIMMVTAYGREQLAGKQASSPKVIDGVLLKPLTASTLFDAVAEARYGVRKSVPAPHTPQQRLSGLRLLVVEDNLTNQQVARELLAHDGAQVEVAGGGLAAIEAVRWADPPFDAVLMDIQMPDMDGYAATRAIRGQLRRQRLPIIAMTANAMASDRDAALAAGMNDHVGKPFDLAQLISVIRVHTTPGEEARVSRVADLGPPSRTSLNSSAALARLGGHTSVYASALRGFIRDADLISARLESALAEQRRDDAARLLHTLKGLAATIGADHLAALSARAEGSLKKGSDKQTWIGGFAAVLEASPRAVEAAQRLVAEIDDRPTTSVSGEKPDGTALKAGLTTLSELLIASNPDALGAFENLRQHHGTSMPVTFARLKQALEMREYARASRLCAEVILHLDANAA